MGRKKIFVSGLMICFAGITSAQQKNNDTTIRATTIEITQIYQPQIRQAIKETYQPTLPVVDPTPPRFTYEVPDHRLNYSYKPLPLQALALPKDSLDKGYSHYVKAGFGNRRTLYLDAGTGHLSAKNFESTAHLGILSQKGDLTYQRQTMASLTANGTYTTKKNRAFDFGLDATHHNFFQYGYDEVAQPNKIPTKQTLSGGKIAVSSAAADTLNTSGFTPLFKAYASAYTGNNISNEVSIGGLIDLVKLLSNELTFTAGANATATKLNSAVYSVNNNFVGVKAGINYKPGQKFSLKAFLQPTLAQNSNSFLLQDVAATLHFDNAQTNIGVGTKGTLVQNTYQQLFLTNPYISSFSSQQTHSNEVFAFIEKGLGHHLTLSGRLSWWQWENLVTFLNNPIGDHEKMMVYYIPKANALSLQIGMRYQVGQMISFGGQLSLFHYNNVVSTNKVWHTPTTRLSGDFMWNPIPELSLTAYGSYMAGNFALDNNLNEVKLKAFTDLGVGAEYNVMERLSFFLNGNNLLNNKYQRWMGYQAYGINIYGGVRLKF